MIVKIKHCDFCKKRENQIKLLIMPAPVDEIYICNECVDLCSYIIDKKLNKWFQNDAPLKDGWYWRKTASKKDCDPECIEVINGIMVDKRPMDSHGSKWEVYEHDDFKGWLWKGPIKC